MADTPCGIRSVPLPAGYSIVWSGQYEYIQAANKRMAAPMFGGLVTSFAIELLIYPVIFLVAKQFEVWRRQRRETKPAIE